MCGSLCQRKVSRTASICVIQNIMKTRLRQLNFTAGSILTVKRKLVDRWRLGKLVKMTELGFIWVLTKADNNQPNNYYIYNLAFKEPLYAASWGYKSGGYTGINNMSLRINNLCGLLNALIKVLCKWCNHCLIIWLILKEIIQ